METKNNPSISVIIPTYNRADRLKIALDSLVSQTYKNFEVIVCDDGSEDNSKEIAESFKDRLDLIYIWEENWGGPARPRNIGVKTAKYDWICFLDSDDWWYPEKLERSTEFTYDYDLIYHDLDKYSFESGQKIGVIKGITPVDNYSHLLFTGNYIANSSVMTKKELVIKAGWLSEDKHLVAIEDYILWFNISKLTNRFICINESLGGYLVHESISFVQLPQIKKELYFLENYIFKISAKDAQKAIRNRYYSWACRLFYEDKNFEEANRYFKKAFCFSKFVYRIKSLIYLFAFFIKMQKLLLNRTL